MVDSIAHRAGPQAPAIAATHGYTLAFTISAALLGLGAILALPSRKRLEELISEASALIPRAGPVDRRQRSISCCWRSRATRAASRRPSATWRATS